MSSDQWRSGRWMSMSWTGGPDGVIDFSHDYVTVSDGAGTEFESFLREDSGDLTHWLQKSTGYRYHSVFHALNQSGAMHAEAAMMVEQAYLNFQTYLEAESETRGE